MSSVARRPPLLPENGRLSPRRPLLATAPSSNAIPRASKAARVCVRARSQLGRNLTLRFRDYGSADGTVLTYLDRINTAARSHTWTAGTPPNPPGASWRIAGAVGGVRCRVMSVSPATVRESSRSHFALEIFVERVFLFLIQHGSSRAPRPSSPGRRWSKRASSSRTEIHQTATRRHQLRSANRGL